MGYKSLDAATMIAVSDPWIDENRDRPILMSYPLTAGLVPILDAAHNGLLRIQLTPSRIKAKLQALAEKALLLDGDHDDRFRAMYNIGTAWAAVSDEARRNIIETLLNTLWPEGLSGIQRSYLTEAGNVEFAVTRLTPALTETMESIVVEGKDLFQMFNEWVAVGRQLGEVERERVRLTESEDGDEVTAGDIQQARYRWIRAANALSTLLDLESDIPEADRVRILQPLLTAEAKATRKRVAGDPVEGPDPTETEEAEAEEVTAVRG